MMVHVNLVILMLQLVPILGNSSSQKNSSSLAPALYVFGDSILDSGNNNLLPTLAKADFSPYGMNFVRGGPTGRFTNGRTVADFIAEFLGLPYSPPYLSLKRLLSPGKLQQLGGLNFASGSCGILPQTGSALGKCLNFDEQIELFGKRVKQELYRKKNDNVHEVLNYLAKSIFVISVGSNDYINNYIDTQHFDTSQRYTPQSYAKHLIARLSQQLKRLYELGARKVVVFEIGPVGCIPFVTRGVEHEGQCVEEINQSVVMFNDHLAPMLRNLTSTLPSSAFILGRAHSLGYDAAINPSNYGLKESRMACCVTWLNGSSGCIPELGAWACPHPEKNYFWDGYHLTETLYRIIATRCFYGPSLCTPFNIKHLLSL